VFRGGVSYVRVDAQVVEGRRLVADLSEKDFLVLDEGSAQPILYFGRESEPLWVALLLDISGSMRRRLQEMAAAARQALGLLRAEDHVALILFSKNARVDLQFTTDRAAAAAAIADAHNETELGSGTAINAAALEAAGYVGKQLAGQAGRRAIVILTDNEGLNYQVADEQVLGGLYQADAVLNAIVPGGVRPPATPRPGVEVNPDFTPSDVFRLARETGGEVLKAENAGASFREMMERIRTRYSLHYRAPQAEPGSRRRIRVELTAQARRRHPRAEVRARTAYQVPR